MTIQELNRSNKILKFIVVGILLIACWLLWKSCHTTPIGNQPQVIPTAEQVKVVNLQDEQKKKIEDSFNLILKKQDNVIMQGQGKYDDLLALYLNQQNDANAILTQVVPDTCKPYQEKLIAQYNRLALTSQQKDNASKSLIGSLREQNNTQKKFLSAKDTAFKKLHNSFDTCIANAQKLEQYVKDIKPRNQVYVGLSMVGNPNKIYSGIGLNLGLKTKKGWMYEVGAIQMGITTQFSIGLKKVISLRRK